jgi:hypothetical protein
VNDIIGIAMDADAGSIEFFKNGVSMGVAFTGMTNAGGGWLFGADSDPSGTLTFNFGQRPFAYTPPTGFKALNTQNLPASTVVDGGEYFNTVLYTGNGSSGKAVTGVGFSPDLLWIKERSSSSGHIIFNKVVGTSKYLESNSSGAEATNTTELASIDSDGFTVNANNATNENNQTYVAWNWKANGAGVTNTDGSITSTVSANTTAGFSVVTYTGTGAAATVGHGLGVAPGMVIVKRRDSSGSWNVYHASTGNTGAMYLELTNAFATDSTRWNNTSPTSSVFTVGSGAGVNASGGTMVAYCFAPVAGYSAFGSYTGNGSADGPFVYLGFRPAFVMIKRTDAVEPWNIYDNRRLGYNPASKGLYPNASDAENDASGRYKDLVSNGFKIRGTSGEQNASGGAYIFMAFAESPFRNSLAR